MLFDQFLWIINKSLRCEVKTSMSTDNSTIIPLLDKYLFKPLVVPDIVLEILMCYHVYQLASVTITKYHRPGGLNDRNFFPQSSGGCKSKRKVPEGFVSHKTFLLDLSMATMCHVLSWPLLCVYKKSKLWCFFLFLQGQQTHRMRASPL